MTENVTVKGSDLSLHDDVVERGLWTLDSLGGRFSEDDLMVLHLQVALS